MVLRWLFHYLLNNEQLINRLADSNPVRKAARFVVNMFIIGRDTVGKLRDSSILERYEESLKKAAEALKKADSESKPSRKS